MKRSIAAVVVVLALVGGLAACETATRSTAGQSTVSVFLTDAPLDLDGVHAVNVTLSGLLLYPTESGSGDAGGLEFESGPISVPGGLTLNLLDFRNGQLMFLGSQSVPAGSYGRLRLLVVSAELVHDDDGDPATPDITEAITVPSGKADVLVPFELPAGESVTVTIDFDAQASVQVNTTNGRDAYLLRPVINLAGPKAS